VKTNRNFKSHSVGAGASPGIKSSPSDVVDGDIGNEAAWQQLGALVLRGAAIISNELARMDDKKSIAAVPKRRDAKEKSDVIARSEAAELLGVHPRTIRKLVQRDGLPTLRRVGKQWRFSQRELLAWMESSAIRARSGG